MVQVRRRNDKLTKKLGLTGSQAVLSLLCFCVLAVLSTLLIWKGVLLWRSSSLKEDQYDTLIQAAGLRNGVEPALLKAVIWKESRFDRYQIGTKGEIGLMQIMPKFAAKEWADAHHVKLPGPGALADPALNIEIGSWFLARALRRWDKYDQRIALALCEYNAGYQRAKAWKPVLPDGSVMDKINIASTRQYVSEIQVKYKEYRKEFQKQTEK